MSLYKQSNYRGLKRKKTPVNFMKRRLLRVRITHQALVCRNPGQVIPEPQCDAK